MKLLNRFCLKAGYNQMQNTQYSDWVAKPGHSGLSIWIKIPDTTRPDVGEAEERLHMEIFTV